MRMNMTGNTISIPGSTSGIGLALRRRFEHVAAEHPDTHAVGVGVPPPRRRALNVGEQERHSEPGETRHLVRAAENRSL